MNIANLPKEDVACDVPQIHCAWNCVFMMHLGQKCCSARTSPGGTGPGRPASPPLSPTAFSGLQFLNWSSTFRSQDCFAGSLEYRKGKKKSPGIMTPWAPFATDRTEKCLWQRKGNWGEGKRGKDMGEEEEQRKWRQQKEEYAGRRTMLVSQPVNTCLPHTTMSSESRSGQALRTVASQQGRCPVAWRAALSLRPSPLGLDPEPRAAI